MSVDITALSVTSDDDDLSRIIAKATDELCDLGRIRLDTEREIAIVSKESGIGKRAICNEIKLLAEERKRNSAMVVEADYNTQVIEIGNTTWNLSDTGYMCFDGQIICQKTNDMVLPHICLPVASVFDVEDKTYKEMLLFNTLKNPRKFETIIVETEDTHSKNRIVGLSLKGIDITSEKAGDFIDFLQQLRIKQGEMMKEVKVINRIGWYEGKLLPYEAGDSDIVIKDGNEKRMADAFSGQKGEKEKSLDMIKEVLNEISIAPVVLGSIVSSLIVERLGRKGQTHVLNINGKSGKGKSVLIKLLYSLLGDSVNSDDMFGGSDATINSGQNTAGYLRNFPLYLDDPLQAGKEDFKQAQQRIYNLVSGSGRQRLNRYGESRKSKEWFCNIIYTNESPLYESDTTIKGGVLSRILDIELENELSQATVNKWLVEVAKNNYGHFGKDFAEEIRSINAEQANEDIHNEYELLSAMGVDRKRGNTSATIAYGFKIACKVLGIDMAFPYALIAKNVSRAGEISDGARGWLVLDAWINGNMEKFRTQVDVYGVTWGNLDYVGEVKVLNIQIAKLREVCSQLSVPRDKIIVHCVENGLVIPSEDGTIVRSVKIKRDNAKVISFKCNWNNPQSFDDEEYPFA